MFNSVLGHRIKNQLITIGFLDIRRIIEIEIICLCRDTSNFSSINYAKNLNA